MESSSPEIVATSKGPRRKIELPWLIMGALLLSTILAAFQSSRQLNSEAESRFRDIAQAERRAVERQLHDMEDLMYGVGALTSALPGLNQATWDTYFDARMPIPEDYMGLVAMQYLATAGHTHEPMTRVFVPTRPSQVQPAWNRQPEIAEAMARAGATRKVVISRGLGQLPGLPELSAGVAMVMALGPDDSVRAQGATPRSGGYLIAILDLNVLMSQVGRSRHFPVLLELFDGGRQVFSPPEVQISSASPQLMVDTTVEVGQRVLRLRISSTPSLEGTLQNNTPRAILLIGVLSSVLLAGLIWLLTRLREQAESLATSMTRKLQDQTKFTEDLIEFNPSPIFRKDADGRFVSVNRAWEQLSGRNRQDILGRTYRDFQAPEIAAQNEELDRRLLESESGYEMAEAFITNADNKQFETIIAKQVLRGSDDTVKGLIGTITDVTPIKRLERELALRREQLDLVIRSSQQGIWDIELKPGGTTYFSERFHEILGYQDGEFPASFEWEQALHPDDLDEFRRHMVDHFKGRTPLFDVESRVRRKDGTYIWVRTRAIAQHDGSGNAVRFIGSISDVTDRKQAEQELLEANVRVTEAARAKEAFLATMSHEIRTPLNGVLGMTSLLSETNLNDEQRDYIRLIRASGDTLLRLIDDVLDFSKIESGRMTLESVPVEIVPVAEEAFELVAEKAREKQLALLFDVADDVPFYILGDATRIRQILLNLLSNAIKFTERGEIRLTLSARRTSDGQLELEGRVADTGIGIPVERASQLFQPFTQVDASTTRKYGGTGLGLAICKRLTQLMGGDIRVESEEGKGATFIFTILTQHARGPLKPYMQRDVFDFLGKRLLIVDRTASRLPLLKRRYSRWGFEVVTTGHADAARLFRAGPRFDVLLTDMVLPSPEAGDMQAGLAYDDAERERLGQPRMVSVLQSTVSRAELSQRGIVPPLRHDIFIMRPANRAKLFDVLMRAVLHEPNHDIATRPYTPVPVYEREFKNLMQSAPATAEPRSPVQGLAMQRQIGEVVPRDGATPLDVLVAEDNEVNQRVIMGMLKNMGHRSVVVGDGRAAVNCAIAQHFDVVLMDIHMPELDGVGAMKEIREHLAGQRCPPIAAMTAHALPGDREHYLAAGMDDYIAKPIRSAELAALLDRVRESATPSPWKENTVDTLLAAPAVPVASASTASAALATSSAQRAGALPILDTEQLEDLRYLPAASGESQEEDDAVGGLIRLFQTKAQERMEAMDAMLGSGDWHGLAETSHSLRGASASMGFPRVAALCKDLELAARRVENEPSGTPGLPSQADLDGLFAQIRLYYAEADEALKAWLESTATKVAGG